MYAESSKIFVSDVERIKNSHRKSPKSIGRRCETARLISRAQLALSLGAVSNLRFSSERNSASFPVARR